MSDASVSVLIATRDRHADLGETLLRLQRCKALINELIVIDDGSAVPVESIVRRYWPEAIVIRQEESAGQCHRRSEGFELASQPFILQLDDDSSPVEAHMLAGALSILRTRPEIALIAFHVFNGPDIPEDLPARKLSHYTASFVGCGALIRTQAVIESGGYASCFGNEWEEEELSIRLMKAGWGLYYDPSLIVHHRVSKENRRSDRTWMRGFRNKLWSLVMHFPLHRILSDGAWVLAIACWDAIRMLRVRWFAIGVWQFAAGLSRAYTLRNPMSEIVMARYDALRFRQIHTREEFDSPPAVTFRDIWRWFTGQWWNRARQRSFWDRRSGDTGMSPTVGFIHQKSINR